MAQNVEDAESTVNDFQIINAVKKNPILWDSSNNQYRNTGMKNKCWENVAVEFQVTSGNVCLL